MSLIDVKKFDEVIDFAKEIKKLIVITRGEKGAVAINNEEVRRMFCKKKSKN